MKAVRPSFWVMLVAGFALAAPALPQEESIPAGEDICAPRGLTIPFAAARPRAWNIWISNGDLKDRNCKGVAVAEIRSRAKRPPRGELEVAFKVTLVTKAGPDRKVSVMIEVLADRRVLKTATIARIDAEERKSGRGSGFLLLPLDMIQREANPLLRISLDVADD